MGCCAAPDRAAGAVGRAWASGGPIAASSSQGGTGASARSCSPAKADQLTPRTPLTPVLDEKTRACPSRKGVKQVLTTSR